jgi:uncharacterized cofD-like protein
LRLIEKYGEKTDVFQRIIDKFNIPNPNEAKMEVIKVYNSDDVPKITLFPEVIPLLKKLKEKKIKTAIVTSGLFGRQTKKIEILNLKNFVDHIIIHDVEKDASKENALKLALKKMNSKPNEVISVGDKIRSEIKISNSIGLRTVRLLHGRFRNDKPTFDLEEADYSISNISEISKILTKIEKKSFPNIVVVGGGTGTSILLRGLKKLTPNLTAVVAVTDWGRTTGLIRNDFGLMGTGDIRNCLSSLSNENGLMSDLFNYRFKRGAWKDFGFGNIFLAALAETTGSYQKALAETSKILAIKGQVLPATFDSTNICVKLENGKIIEKEVNISSRGNIHHKRSPIKKAFLKPANVKPLPEVLKAIKEADVIVIGPGGLFTSVISNLLIKDLSKSIKNSKAKKIFVSNIMTQQGQTDNYSSSKHVQKILDYLNMKKIDYAIFNTKIPDKNFLKAYEKEHAFIVKNDKDKISQLVKNPIYINIIQKNPKKQKGENRLEYLRHDPDKIAQAIINILN